MALVYLGGNKVADLDAEELTDIPEEILRA